MNNKKVYFGLVGLIVILCLALVVGAKIATNELSGKSTAVVALEAKQQSLEAEQSQLAEAKAEIKKYQPLADIAKSIVPQDKNQAETVREIVNIAAASGVSLSGVTFPKSDLGTPGQSTSSTALNLSQLTVVKGLSGVYQLPITITNTQDVSYDQFLNFLSRLENNRRTAQVTDMSLTPDSNNPGQLSFTLSINEYIKT